MANQPKKYQKFVATAATATLVAAAIVPTASAAGFNDTSNYDKETLAELDRAVELGFVKGFENGDFKPADYVTRGQVAKILARHIAAEEGYDTDLNGLKKYVEDFEITDGFSDVSEKRDSELYFASLIVKDAEVFTGNEKNQLLPEKNITRQQMAKVLVNAFGLEGTDEEVEISDLDKATKEFQEYIVILAQNGVTKANPYKPGEAVKRIQMASFSVRAYDASPAADLVEVAALEVKDATTLAVSVTEANKDLTAENFKVQVDGKEVEVKAAASNGDGSIYTLTIASLDGKKGEVEVNGVKKAYDFTATVVESIKAINASELQVNFSQAVDEKTATAKGNYELKINNHSDAEILDIQLSKDGKVATILLDQSITAKSAFQNGDKYVIQTKDAILSKEGKKIEKFVTEVTTFGETDAPKLVKTIKDGNNLEFTFDRPVHSYTANGEDVTLVKVDGIEINSKDLKPVKAKTGNADILGTAGDYRYTVEIKNPTALKQAEKLGEHEVVVFDVKDTASDNRANASVVNGTYTVTDEVTAPEVTGIEAVNANRVFVYTNVKVDPIKLENFTVNKGAHTFNNVAALTTPTPPATAEAAATVGEYKNKPGIWVVVTDSQSGDTNPLYRANEASVDLTVTFEKFTKNGLVGKKSTQNVTLNKNNTKPVVEKTELQNNTDLVVTFDNELSAAAANLVEGTDYVVRNKEGIIVTGFNSSYAVKDDKGEITFNKGVNLEDAPYTVEFKEGKFATLENPGSIANYVVNTVKNSAFTVTVGKNAESNFKYIPFDVEKQGNPQVGDNVIEFTYPEKMSDTARDVANYTLDGNALPAGTTVDFVNDRKTVKIVFPKNTFKTDTKYKLGITTNVQTEAGSIIVGSLQTKAPAEYVFDVKDNIAPELASAVYYVGTNKIDSTTVTDEIEVTFTEAVKNVAKEDFVVEFANSTYNVTTAEPVGNDKVKLRLSSPVNVSQAATISIIKDTEKIQTTDLADNKAKAGSSIVLEAGKYEFNYKYAEKMLQKEIDSIPATFEAEGQKGDKVLPSVSKGYEIKVDQTNDAAIYTTEGKLESTGTTKVNYIVTNTETGQSASKEVDVEVTLK